VEHATANGTQETALKRQKLFVVPDVPDVPLNGGTEAYVPDHDPFASLKDESLLPDLPAFLDRRARP
jgi:hypothetical protein